MDPQVIDQKLESLRRCLMRIESKQPFDAKQLAERATSPVSSSRWRILNQGAPILMPSALASSLRAMAQRLRKARQSPSATGHCPSSEATLLASCA